MHSFHLGFALMLSCGVVLSACGRDRGADLSEPQSAATAQVDKDDLVEVTGCLTSNDQNNQFVLTADANLLTSTASRAGSGEVETYTYQLIGGMDLPAHVGRQVTVTGTVEKDDDVDVETTTKTEQPPARGVDARPAVESTERIELEVRRMTVASVKPTGQRCQLGTSK